MNRASDPGRRGALNFRMAFLLVLMAAISVLFLLVVYRFLLAIFLAAIFAGLHHGVRPLLLSWTARTS